MWESAGRTERGFAKSHYDKREKETKGGGNGQRLFEAGPLTALIRRSAPKRAHRCSHKIPAEMGRERGGGGKPLEIEQDV